MARVRVEFGKRGEVLLLLSALLQFVFGYGSFCGGLRRANNSSFVDLLVLTKGQVSRADR